MQNNVDQDSGQIHLILQHNRWMTIAIEVWNIGMIERLCRPGKYKKLLIVLR